VPEAARALALQGAALASPAEDDATNKARYEAGKVTIGAESALSQTLSTMKAHD
jgi:hypothetical protein